MINENVGKYIRKIRTERGFSIRQLALQSGVSASYISRLENNRTKHLIKTSTIQKLANGLRIDEKELFEMLDLSDSYSTDRQNQILNIPLVKNPLLSTNIDDELNLVKYIPFLKEQINEKSKYVINYHGNNDYKLLDNYYVVLSGVEELSNLVSDKLVVFLKEGEFYLGRLKYMNRKIYFIDQRFNLFEIKLNKNLKKHLFNVELFFKGIRH